MTYSRTLVAGLCAIVLLTVLPLTLLSSHTSDEAVLQLLNIGRLQTRLQVDALFLRLGLTNNYDELMETMHELRSRTDSLVAQARDSGLPQDQPLLESLARIQEAQVELDDAVMQFPTYNASFLNAVASLRLHREQLVEGDHSGLGDPAWSAEELERICGRTLSLQAAWDAELARRVLQEHRQALVERPPTKPALLPLLRHVEIALEHRLQAEDLLLSIETLGQEASVDNEVTDHLARIADAKAQGRYRSLWIQSISFTLAFLVCIALCVFGWRQSETLKREIEQHRIAYEEARLYEVQLRSAQKLESIGQLAAGVAHEINTPTQYVGDNTRFLEDSFREVVPLLTQSKELVDAMHAGSGSSELAELLRAALEEADIEYLSEEIPRAIEQSLGGIERVRKIVQSMKEFSHPDAEEMTNLDIHRAIESTVTVSTSEWKYVAEVETDFDPDLSVVPCLPGEINQVVLNLIVNAAHAIADVVDAAAGERGKITIATRRDGKCAEIRITDTGTGIPEAAREKIFDPFFTTKDVGKGTGQGLSLAHGVVVKKHGGTLTFETELGRGTTFVIRLPLERPQVAEPTPI